MVTFLQGRYPPSFLSDAHPDEDDLFPMETYIVTVFCMDICDLLYGAAKDSRGKAEHTFAFRVGTTISS